MKRLSVIIPVHNAKDDLPRCVESIVGQLSGDDELLLIEDSSTDGSYEMCDAFASENPLIRTFHVNFKGPSPTRNHGIAQSQGEYILFIDADDWIEDNTVNAMLERMQQHQLVVMGYYMESENAVSEKKLTGVSQLETEDVLALYRTELLNVLWNKMFVASVIKDNDIAFDINLKKGEDLLFVLQYIQCMTGKIAVLEGCYYHYISKTTGINRSHIETVEDKVSRFRTIMGLFRPIVKNQKYLAQHMLNLYFRMVRDFLAVADKKPLPAKILFIKKQARNAVVNEILYMGKGAKLFMLKALHWLHMDLSMFVLNKLLLK